MKIFFKTPILLLTFNRSHTIAELIKKLEKIKPVKIYIAQD
jgi:hypothetical protein